jgi:DNA (cytosine-5)-methyltransferase 1
MRALSLCTGIGGIDLGLRRVLPAYRTVAYCERDPYCRAVLKARMADGSLDVAPIWPDVWTFEGRVWQGKVDLVHAGYPCQPFSVAGRRRGHADARNVWPAVAAVVRTAHPALVFLENVPGHLHVGALRVFQDLESMGYRIAARLVAAAEVGAPHRRERLFVLAHSRHAPLGARSWSERGTAREWAPGVCPQGRDLAGEWPPGPDDAGGWAAVLAERPDLAPAMADADGRRREPAVRLRAREEGPAKGHAARPGVWMAEAPVAAQPALRGVADGLSRWVDRVRVLGNACVPAQVARAWTLLWQDLSAGEEDR